MLPKLEASPEKIEHGEDTDSPTGVPRLVGITSMGKYAKYLDAYISLPMYVGS
jgi:hypothetical protein